MKKFFRFLKYIVITILSILLILLLTRTIIRIKNKNDQKITTENGIDEEVIVEIGGIRQYLNIRGEDKSNPIILVLHGGPGSPMTPIIYAYQDGLEKDFVVINWDQRNAGKTYYLNKPNVELSMDRMIEDVREIIDYISQRFGQDKVVILGHSWGTVLGTEFVQKYPELVSAYIGVGQVINAVEGDSLAFDTTKETILKSGNKKDYDKINNLTGYLLSDKEFSFKSFAVYRELMTKYLSPVKDKTLGLLVFSPYYSLKEVLLFTKETFVIQKPLMDYIVNDFDAREIGNKYEVPVYYILGESDWVTPTISAKEFFDTIEAPDKECIIIKNSGHMVMLDNTEEFCKAVISVLNK